MKESVYALDEIEGILMLEVFPVCIASLHSVAVEWAELDENWICEIILSAKRPNRFRRWLNSHSLWKINDDRQKFVEKYQQL